MDLERTVGVCWRVVGQPWPEGAEHQKTLLVVCCLLLWEEKKESEDLSRATFQKSVY